MRPIVDDITGKRFGRLVVICHVKKGYWLCQCDCGKKAVVLSTGLKRGTTKSCGCLYDERRTLTIIDDERARPLYDTWKGMKQRCYNKNKVGYSNYGGKGVKVCDEWRDSFDNFYQWSINNGYKIINGEIKDRLCIDRIDSNGNYCPDNCRWIPMSENSARISGVNEHLEDLDDEMIQEFLERKKENETPISESHFYRRIISYCIIENKDDNKRYLFKSFKNVALFLNITYSAIYYRIKNKNGILNDKWTIRKITKEEFVDYKKQGIDVVI